MKKLIGLLVLLFVIFLAIYRNRIFLRDPIASVTRDGSRQPDVRVLINYPNDVLLQDATGGRQRVYLLQHWNRVLGTPSAPLKCFQGLACMTDADQASALPVIDSHASPRGRVAMSDRQVQFIDEDGALVEVTLR